MERQIDFDPMQKEVAWLAPFMIGFSILCAAIVVIILLSDLEAPFIGPWG